MSASNDGRTTVLFVDTTPFFGPLMQVHGRVMKHLDRSRFRVLLAGVQAGEYDALAAEVPDLEITRFGKAAGAPKGRLLRRVRRAIQPALMFWYYMRVGWLARREHVKVVHVGMTLGMLAAGNVVSLMSGARLVVHAHASRIKASRSKRAMHLLGMRRASAVIAVSSFVRDRLVELGVAPERAHAVLNAVDLTRFAPDNDGSWLRDEYGIARDAPLVLCLGRLFPGKGQHHLLRAMVEVARARDDVRTLIVGWEERRRGPAGGFRRLLDSIIGEGGLEGRAMVGAARPEAPALMAAADIVAVPSTDDPCPLTVLEAMASGKAVVGFRSGGVPEELGDDDRQLVAVGDEDGLARKILALVNDPELRAKVGERNRQRAESRFYEQRLAEDVSYIYQAVLGQSAGARSPRSVGDIP